MKLAYITKQDPNDKKAYSGIHYFMYQALKEEFEQVIPLGPIEEKHKILPKIKGRFLRGLTGKIYKYQYNIGLAKRSAAIIDKKIEEHKPDIVLASLMSPEVAFIENNTPLYITTDATFPLLHQMYGSHSNLHPTTIQEARVLEKKAFEKATKLILPLQWLADSATHHYGISPSNIEVIPYGANFERNLQLDEVNDLITRRSGASKIKLLFVGVRWEEKGGPFAVQVLNEILAKGVEAELNIIGCNPDLAETGRSIHILGFLDKEIQAEQVKLEELYQESTFFILPTKAECIGMSFIEAASYGLPSIGTNVGGVPEAVIHNVSGLICEVKDAKSVAEWIIKARNDKSLYQKLSNSAYNRYLNEMNWKNWAKKFREVILS